mgnify:CR=1 FL=1
MQKINTSGRSMIEMLGVLAIVGVLSVAGSDPICDRAIALMDHINDFLKQLNPHYHLPTYFHLLHKHPILQRMLLDLFHEFLP